MTLRTLTFDPEHFKLAPIKASDMLEVANIEELDRYAALIAAVPDTLPGVIEHSGEPVGLLVATPKGPMYWTPSNRAVAQVFCDAGAEPIELFTHAAPAQPVPDAWVRYVKDCVACIGGSFSDRGRALLDVTPAQPVERQELSKHVNIVIPKGCDCQNVEMGSYANQVELPTPPHMLAIGSVGCLTFRPTTCIDRCIESRVKALWAAGIVTTGCCCGHNEQDGYIGIFTSVSADRGQA